MIGDQPLRDCVASIEAIRAAEVAIEEATALRSQVGHKLFAAIRASVRNPDDPKLASQARRLLGEHARTIAAVLELRAAREVNVERLRHTANTYRVDLREVVAHVEDRRSYYEGMGDPPAERPKARDAAAVGAT